MIRNTLSSYRGGLFWAVALAGLLFSAVLDFVARHPDVTALVLVAAFMVTRPALPFSYTFDQVVGRVSAWFAFALELVLGAGLYVALDALLGGHVWRAVVAVVAVYVADRVVAWTIREQIAVWVRRRDNRRPAVVVDAEVVS